MKITRVYRVDFIGRKQREKEEKKLAMQGYKPCLEEEIREWDAGQACCLLIIFFPLIFLAKVKKIKVVYNNE